MKQLKVTFIACAVMVFTLLTACAGYSQTPLVKACGVAPEGQITEEMAIKYLEYKDCERRFHRNISKEDDDRTFWQKLRGEEPATIDTSDNSEVAQ